MLSQSKNKGINSSHTIKSTAEVGIDLESTIHSLYLKPYDNKKCMTLGLTMMEEINK